MEEIIFYQIAGLNWISKDICSLNWILKLSSTVVGIICSCLFCLMFFCVLCFVTLCEKKEIRKIRKISLETSSVFTIQVCQIFIFAFSCNVWEPTLLLKYRFSTQLFEVELVHLAISKGLWIANLMKNSIYRRSISCRLYHFLLGQYLCFSQ